MKQPTEHFYKPHMHVQYWREQVVLVIQGLQTSKRTEREREREKTSTEENTRYWMSSYEKVEML